MNIIPLHPTANPPKLLLIDDDPVMHKLFECHLKGHFYNLFRLETALTIHDGLDSLKKQCFHFVILDSVLPPFNNVNETIPLIEPHLNNAKLVCISAGGQRDISILQCPISPLHGRTSFIRKILRQNKIKNYSGCRMNR